MELAIEKLRAEISKAVKDPFEDNTVVRWVSAGRYNYAAIKTVAGWFTTANNNAFVPGVVTYEELLDILARSEVSQVAVATEWATL